MLMRIVDPLGFRQYIIEPMMEIYTFKNISTFPQNGGKDPYPKTTGGKVWYIAGNERHKTIIRSSPPLLYP